MSPTNALLLPQAELFVRQRAPRAAFPSGCSPPPPDPSPLRGTLASSLRSPAERERHEGFPPPPEKDLESPSSMRLEALVPSRAKHPSPAGPGNPPGTPVLHGSLLCVWAAKQPLGNAALGALCLTKSSACGRLWQFAQPRPLSLLQDRASCQSGGAPALRPGAIAQSPGREAALAWANLAKRFPASSVLARAWA